jgi:hypothetical protein
VSYAKSQASKFINPFRNGCEIQIPAGLFSKLDHLFRPDENCILGISFRQNKPTFLLKLHCFFFLVWTRMDMSVAAYIVAPIGLFVLLSLLFIFSSG